MAIALRKQALIADLDTARTELAGYGQAFAHDLDVGAKLKRGVRENPAAWFGGATLLGLFISKLLRPRRKAAFKRPSLKSKDTQQAGKAAFALTALKFALDFAKPALLKWANGRIFPKSRATTTSSSSEPRT